MYKTCLSISRVWVTEDKITVIVWKNTPEMNSRVQVTKGKITAIVGKNPREILIGSSWCEVHVIGSQL